MAKVSSPGQLDPVKEWDNFLSSSILIEPFTGRTESQDEVKRRKLKSWAIIILMFLEFVHYFSMIFLEEDTPEETTTRWGAAFHALGFTGRVICISGSCVIFQSAFLRLVYRVLDDKRKLNFLQDFANLRTHEYKKLHYFALANKVTRRMIVSIAYIVTIASGVFAVYKNASVTNIVIWSLWTFFHCLACYFSAGDHITLGIFWFVCRSYVGQLISEITTEFQQIKVSFYQSSNRTRSIRLHDKQLCRWFKKYKKVQKILGNFDHFSQYYLFIFTVISSTFNASVLYGALATDVWFISYLLLNAFLVFVIQGIIQLYGATVINSMGQSLYREANSLYVFIQSEVSLKHKFMLRSVAEDTGSNQCISLTTIGSIPYDATCFAEYVVSFVTMFLMMYDFLDEVL